MSPLDRKLLRDLWRMKGQVFAIAAVIAVGVLLLVMWTGLVSSLDETRRAYYERYRLANVFAPVSRAPRFLLEELGQTPGVTAVLGRVSGNALIDIEGLDLPVRARAISIPLRGEPQINNVYLIAGRQLDPDRSEEILLLESFARAHDLEPGDTIRTTINGLKRSFRIAGLAMSPEFLYTAAPGEFISDDSRYGVMWMTPAAIAAAYDMDGAFNEALLTLGRNVDETAVIDAVDRMLDSYGGSGAYGLEDLLSNRFVAEEIASLRITSRTVPPIFLAVAAFLLYIVISRMVQSEREQIGLTKAFGYTNFEIGSHYMKFVLAIAIAGAVMGCLGGIAAGRAMVDVYLEFFKFPFLVFRLDPASFVIGFAISVISASAGSLFVLRQIFVLAPAVAMRPPAPADYSRAGRFGAAISRFLDQPSRMVMRRLARQPGRMLGAVAGIAAAMALSAAMTSLLSGYDDMLDLSFGVIDRSDLSVTLTHPRSDRIIDELRHINGVIEVEPVRNVGAIMRNGLETYRGGVNGLTRNARLYRAMDAQTQPLRLPEKGVVLSTGLAKTLNLAPGENMVIEVREGRQPVIEVPVAAVAETLFGSPAYMRIDALNGALREANRVSGAYLRIDSALESEVLAKLKAMPSIAGVSRKNDARESMKRIMDEGAGAMRYVMVVIAGIITFGVVYNTARIAQAERSRDLASLRVIGFTRGETAFVLLGELAIVTLLALPIGSFLGYFLSFAIAEGFSTDLYQVPVTFSPPSHGVAAIAVIAAACLSGWLVKRDIDRADLVSALKTRE